MQFWHQEWEILELASDRVRDRSESKEGPSFTRNENALEYSRDPEINRKDYFSIPIHL